MGPIASTDHESLLDLARRTFGFESFRPGQVEALAALLDGHHTLAVMPTGSGKSLVYQLAGLELAGPTIVVSPLLALQRDQVESIESAGLAGGAVELNSQLTDAQRADVLERLATDEIEFCFLAPEQLGRDDTIEALRKAAPSLFVVDEAHCISSWGHDFRPDYLRLGAARAAIGGPTTLALTATASPTVQDEIIDRLGLGDGVERVVAGFERPNLWLGVRTVTDAGDLDATIAELVDDVAGTGLVYVATRERAEDLAALLDRDDRAALAYHAGLPTAERDAVHERFASGEDVVVCATIAFGLGIDVPDVRFVVHDALPDSLDAYYQEVGRAGRDGEPARCVLVQVAGEDGLRASFTGVTAVDGALLGRLLAAVRAHGWIDLSEVVDGEDVSETRAVVAATRLAEAGAVDLRPDGTIVAVPGATGTDEAVVDAAIEAQERASRAVESRASAMRRYAEADRCRWRMLTEYYGEPGDGTCGHCDRCDAGAAPATAGPFDPGQAVSHDTFGSGRVVSSDADRTVVRFDDGGERVLKSDLAADGLLAAS